MKKRSTRLALWLAIALICLTAFCVAWHNQAFAAAAASSVSATNNKSCNGTMTAAQFTLTQVPDTQGITVNMGWAKDIGQPSSYNAGTAIYNVSLDGPLDTPAAVASVPDDWSGTFVVSGVTCAPPVPPVVTTQFTLCGIEPAGLAVRITNKTTATATYTVTVSSLPNMQVDVLPDHTGEVDFQPLTRGQDYHIVVTGSDGSNMTMDGSAPTCPAGAPAAPAKNGGKTNGVAAEGVASVAPSASPSHAVAAAGTKTDNSQGGWNPDMDWFAPALWIIISMILLLMMILVWVRHRRNRNRAGDDDEPDDTAVMDPITP